MKARSETVFIENLEGALGTGVVVNDKCAVTAAHVADVPHPQITTEKGTHYSTTRVVNNTDEDIAVICADKALDAPAATFGPTPAPYDYLFTIGFPLGLKYVLTEGRQQEGRLTTVTCAPGNSGGGVWNRQGSYIGFVDSVAVYNGTDIPLVLPHLCNIVRAQTIINILEAHHIPYHQKSS